MKVMETERLAIRHMSIDDAQFMLTLMNDPAWLRYIGDRNIKSLEDAQNYIRKGPFEAYSRAGLGFYVVETKDTGTPMGLCGLAKRDYLDDVDIGFAFLPGYRSQGYAREAATAVLAHAKNTLALNRVVATVRSENRDSTRLLEKLGLQFERMIAHPDGDRELMLFSTALC